MQQRPETRHLPIRIILLATLVLLSIGLCVLALWRGWVRPDTIQQLVGRLRSADGEVGWLAMTAYVGSVIVIELLWMPRMWGLLAGGALFGPLLGGSLSIFADLCSATACYALARGAGRAWVEQLLRRRPRAQKVTALLARRRGGVIVAVLRVCPVAHYTLVSYAAGLSGVGVRPFILGTALGILPGAVLYPIVGDAALRPGSPTFWISLGILVITLVITVAATRKLLRDDEAEPASGAVDDSP